MRKAIIRNNKIIIKDEVRTFKGWDGWGYKTTRKPVLQIAILEYIKTHPDCKRRDLYFLGTESNVRESLTALLKTHKVTERFTIT